MDKYDFQQLLKDYDYSYYQGGGIYHKGSGGKTIGLYVVSNRNRTINTVLTNNSKLKTVCLIHGVDTDQLRE